MFGVFPIADAPNRLAKFQAALASVRAGTRNATIALAGDSTFAGYGAANSGYNGNPVAVNFATYLATSLSATIAAQNSSFFGNNNNVATTITDWDARLTAGASWSNAGGSFGGKWWQSAGADTLAFTPTQQFDTADIYFISGGGNGTFTVNIDGGATLITQNEATSPFNTLRKVSLTTTLGAHTVNIQRSAGTVVIQGVDTYNSASKIVSIWNGGQSGAKAAQLAATVNLYDYANAIGILAPDLTILSCEINDWSALTATGSYQSSLQTVISKALVSGDVLVLTAPGTNPAATTEANQSIYNDVFGRLAQGNHCPLMKTRAISASWGSYAAAVAASFMFDNTHPIGAGYANWAAAVSAFILSH